MIEEIDREINTTCCIKKGKNILHRRTVSLLPDLLPYVFDHLGCSLSSYSIWMASITPEEYTINFLIVV